jgi:hypothetical protein
MFQNLLINNIIHNLEPFDCLFLCDTNVLLLKGHRSEAVVKIVQPFSWVNSQEGSNIFIVRECGTEANQTDIFLSRLNVSDGSGHKRFKDGSTIIVQQMDFILW